MGQVASALAVVGAVMGFGVFPAWAGTEKPLPQEASAAVGDTDGAPTVAMGGDARFILLNLAGRTVKWGESRPGTGAVVRYAFVTADTQRPDAINCRTLTPIGDRLARSDLRQADFAAELRRAMDDWSTVADIRFQPVVDPAVADLLIGGDKDARGIAFADVARDRNAVTGTGKGFAAISRAAVCFNLGLAWENRFDGDPTTPNVRYVAAHELGHVLGLDHAWGQDKLMRFQYEERFQTPQPPDIAGAAFLYGPRPAGSGSFALIRNVPTAP